MTEPALEVTGAASETVEGEPLTRAFYDIAQLLESAEDAETRVARVLSRLRSFVTYGRCAVLDAVTGSEPHLIVAADTPQDELDDLRLTLSAMLTRLGEDSGPDSEPPRSEGHHLAVPLVGLDQVVGVLFVRRTDGRYEERHLRALSVVAAKLAAYFSMLRARAVQAKHIRELAQARQAAEIANRAKDEFLALVSHELRTPLNTILTWADVLRELDSEPEERLRAFEAIERNVHAQALLVEELLELSCVSAAAVQLEPRALEPAKLIRDVVSSLVPQATRKSIELDVTLDEAAPPLVGDPRRLTQVIGNLVANAIKFTPEGGHVEVRLERAGALARIHVIDSGSGIEPEVLGTLFAPFQQADSSTTRALGGLGVGLALVKKLVELHGGRVSAHSAGEQRGATFTVELPWDGTTEPVPPEERAPTSRHEGPLSGVRVLVVDDDEDTAEAVRMILEDKGAVVVVAQSVAGALESLELALPDVLLSDLRLPGATGHDLMRRVVAERGDAAPPAAAISGAGRKDLAHVLASGFQLLLEKPVDPTALVGAVVALAELGPAAVAGGRLRSRSI